MGARLKSGEVAGAATDFLHRVNPVIPFAGELISSEHVLYRTQRQPVPFQSRRTRPDNLLPSAATAPVMVDTRVLKLPRHWE